MLFSKNKYKEINKLCEEKEKIETKTLEESKFDVLEEILDDKFKDRVQKLLKPIDNEINRLNNECDKYKQSVIDATISMGDNAASLGGWSYQGEDVANRIHDICRDYKPQTIDFKAISILCWNNDIEVNQKIIRHLKYLREEIIKILGGEVKNESK